MHIIERREEQKAKNIPAMSALPVQSLHFSLATLCLLVSFSFSFPLNFISCVDGIRAWNPRARILRSSPIIDHSYLALGPRKATVLGDQAASNKKIYNHTMAILTFPSKREIFLFSFDLF